MPMTFANRKNVWVRLSRTGAFLAVLCVVLLIHCAVPFVGVPTLGQALWASGFAQSYVNHGWLSIYATDFGQPIPAAIAFGLSGTFVQGIFMRLAGVHAIDAYTMMFVFYLGCALYGASAMARRLGAPFYSALLLGVLWLALPIVWGHGPYSMLSLGFALLPLYLYSADTLFDEPAALPMLARALRFLLVCVVAAFMDGYTFVMFFLVAAVVLAGALISGRLSRWYVVRGPLPTIVAGFSIAYLLYRNFVDMQGFDPSPIDFFRAWGVDLVMLAKPTRGVLWLWDTINWAANRSDKIFWGDASVWVTTFVAPLLVLGIAGFIVAKDRQRAAQWMVIALIGTYFALGPSLKIASTKQVVGATTEETGVLMPEKYAVMPTGSAWVSENIPGFKNMRAPYRWMGMGALGLWALGCVFFVRLSERNLLAAQIVIMVAVVTFLPHVANRLRASIDNRERVRHLDEGLLRDLDTATGVGKTVFFAPYSNDFLVGYLAASGGFKALNIGGDKNVASARTAWSASALMLDDGHLHDPAFLFNARKMLLTDEVDMIIFPYFDPYLSVMRWPPEKALVAQRKDSFLPIAREIAASDCFELVEYPLFSTVSLSAAGMQLARAIQDRGGTYDVNTTDRLVCAK
jgi:hypothetical protein